MPGRREDSAWTPLHLAAPIDPRNPRTYPVRPNYVVADEVRRANQQLVDIEASMDATGQTGALVIGRLDAVAISARGSCSLTTWRQGPTTVLPVADVLELFELPSTVEADPQITYVRWDTVERVCAATCWQAVPDLDPTRIITRRWPSAAELEVIRGLSLPAPR